jgi:hypothetical protein
MAAPVWILSVDLQAKTATFQSGMAEAAKSARGSFTEIKSGAGEMGGHVSTNMFASRHAIMAVTESLGVQMPRAITALLVHIGPLGAALEAAFPFAAIALAAVLLIEHLSKLHEEGVKLTEDQVKFGTAVQMAFNSLDQKFLSAGIRADELRNDHLGALHLQLELIDKQSVAELVHSFAEVAKAADTVFDELKTHWYEVGIGAEGAKHAVQVFQDQYGSLLAQGKTREASDLLKGTRESAAHILAMMKQARDNSATQTGGNNNAASELALEQARAELKKAGVNNTEKELRAQQTLLGVLDAQVVIEAKSNALKVADKSNATTATGKEGASRSAEAAKQAAEHAQKMGELSIAMEREQARVMLDIKEASIAERLAMDLRLADEEYNLELRGNKQLQDALNKGGADYANQRKALLQKADEITAEHNNAVAALNGKAEEDQYRESLRLLTESEREKIDATREASAERLAAIDSAIKEEQAKGLQSTQFYRDLQNQRVQVQRQADEEANKLAAEAGKEQADSVRATGEIALAAWREQTQLLNSLRRVSYDELLAQDIDFANKEHTLKLSAMQQDADALDKTAKDYDNKLKAIQDKELQRIQQHENDVAALRAKSQAKQTTDQQTALASMEKNFASAFTQVLMGHQSFAAMMGHASQQLVGNLITAGIDMANHLNDGKLQQAEAAARWGFSWGAQYGGPAAPVLAPMMAATFFTGVMAFADGGVVPGGIGAGDVVPAMLTPGEGVIPGGMMAQLNEMARSGNMGGGTHYHASIHYAPVVNAVDGDGVEKMLDKHGDKFQRHVETTLRKLNR